ncbi:MAG: hypothetical protein K2X27_00925, partial [Candidatus Obscuribacterales bacterium]|nr:hypothetical protein [Candidatus Obscuribacterales bacterium]
GIGGSLGRAKESLEQLRVPAKQKSKTSNTLIARDPRFEFSRNWIPLLESPASRHKDETDSNGRHIAKVEHWDFAKKAKSTLFMPTEDAVFKLSHNQISLESGAVLVRAEKEAALVHSKISGHPFSVRVAAGALALISNVDGKPFVINLTDRCCGAVVATLPGSEGQRKLSLAVGEIIELFEEHEEPFSTYISSKIIANEKLHLTTKLQLGKCHYTSAMRRYNLDRALEKTDMDRVLKTAAAMVYVNPIRK